MCFSCIMYSSLDAASSPASLGLVHPGLPHLMQHSQAEEDRSSESACSPRGQHIKLESEHNNNQVWMKYVSEKRGQDSASWWIKVFFRIRLLWFNFTSKVEHCVLYFLLANIKLKLLLSKQISPNL